jgi:hypothetical protein
MPAINYISLHLSLTRYMKYKEFVNPGQPKIAEADLIKAENAIGLKFPPAYRNFLLEVNGGEPKQPAFKWLAPGEDGPLFVRNFYSLDEFIEAQAMKFDESLYEQSIFIIAHTHSPIVICMSFKPLDLGKIFTFGWDEGLNLQAENLDMFLNQLEQE